MGSGWAVLRPLVLRLHFYAGVLVAPFLAIACLTGIVYVFSPQLSDLVYSDELLVGPHAGAPRPLDDQVAAAVAAHPEGTLNSLVVDSDPGRTTGVVLDVDGLPEDTQRTVYVDPYTAGVRGSLDTWFDTPPLQTTLDALHRNLLLGEPGRLYSELAASWLWVVVLGGLALWIGKRRGRRKATAALLPPLRMRPGRRRIMGWHGATGVWLTVALLFLSATGLTWSNYAGGRFSTFVDAVKSSTPTLTAEPVPLRDAPLITVQDAVDRARAGGLEGPLKVTPPAEPGTPFTVAEIARDWPVQRDEVALDPYTGAVTETIVWSDFPVLAKLTRIGILAHMGSLFGLVSQLALVATALGLLSLIFWGYRMWWQRRPTRNAFRLTPPVRRGTLRALSQPASFAVVLLAVAVGWMLPVLGVSLVVFLLADAAAGALARRRAPGSRAVSGDVLEAARRGGTGRRRPHVLAATRRDGVGDRPAAAPGVEDRGGPPAPAGDAGHARPLPIPRRVLGRAAKSPPAGSAPAGPITFPETTHVPSCPLPPRPGHLCRCARRRRLRRQPRACTRRTRPVRRSPARAGDLRHRPMGQDRGERDDPGLRTLTATGPGPVTIVAARTTASPRTELHEVVMSDGAMKMRPKEGGFVVEPGSPHLLAPGGDHIMIMDLVTPIRAGDQVEVTLDLANGTTTSFTALAKDTTGGQENYESSTSDAPMTTAPATTAPGQGG